MQKRITKLTFPKIPTAKKKVAAYARVSSGKDAMLHSFLHRSAITAVLFRRITTGNMSVYTLTRLSQSPKKSAKIFKGF